MQLNKELLPDVQVLSDIVQQAGLREGQHVTLDLQISAYVDDAGACDRIQKTCIPQSYTRHTSRAFLQATLPQVHINEKGGHGNKLRSFYGSPGPQSSAPGHQYAKPEISLFAGFLVLFLTFLPFTLWEVLGWLSPLAEALIAFLFMGIDNIGDYLFRTTANGTSMLGQQLSSCKPTRSFSCLDAVKYCWEVCCCCCLI